MTMLGEIDEEDLGEKEIEVVNIVGKLDLEMELDLKFLNRKFHSSEYNPSRYPSLVFSPPNLSTVMITKSGIILFTGANSIKNLYRIYVEVSKEMSNIGIDSIPDFEQLQITNVVGKYDFGSNIDLNLIHIEAGMENVEYEPEQFPGLIYKPDAGGVALIFSSGKIIITGVVNSREMVSTVESSLSNIPG